jgi:hypothetical protein
VKDCSKVPLSDGYTDVPRGKIAAVVTSLEMLARPRTRPDPPHSPWRLRRVVDPEPGWFRGLYRRVGQDWLWFSRLMVSDDALAAIIRNDSLELYALEYQDSDEGLLELDFRQPGACELSFFGVTPGLIGTGARPLADEPGDRASVGPPDCAALGAHLHARSPARARLLSSIGIFRLPSANRGRR